MAKIAIFISSFGDGGAHKNMMNIAEWISEQGHSVDLIITKAEGPLRYAVPDNVTFYNLKTTKVRHSLFRLIKYIHIHNPDSLISTPTACNLVAGITDQLLMRDVQVTLRIPAIPSNEPFYTDPTGIQRLYPYVGRYVYNHAEKIIAISKGVREDLINTFDVDNDKISVIYNPAVTDELFQMILENVDHPYFNKSNNVFIAAGRFIKQKGFEILIRAFEKVNEKTDSKLIILGDGRLKEDLVDLIKTLSLEENISLPGFVKNPYKYMYNADIFVLSSLSEGFGNVVVEALACGTPVISTNCKGGPSEILDEGKYGSLVPTNSIDALADTMISKIDQDINTTELQKRAKDFHIDNIAPQYLNEILR